MGKNISIKLPLMDDSNLVLEKAVCNHGYFMMAPNKWLPDKKAFVRPLTISNNNSTATTVTVTITQQPPQANYLTITYHLHDTKTKISKQHIRKSIQEQVSRMLRISQRDELQLNEFYKIHPQAKDEGFGRIIRSPTIFEDIVKSFLLCNVTWSRSLEMAQALCDFQLKMSKKKKKKKEEEEDPVVSLKRKRYNKSDVEEGGNFPTLEELSSVDEQTLNKHCNLGYRASYILKIVGKFSNGKLNISKYFEHENSPDELVRKLKNINGFGPFSVANTMMCLGIYDRIPIDTETVKHVQQVHGITTINKENKMTVIGEIYDKFAPYQCLAYWRERVEYYENNVGKLSNLSHIQYGNVVTPKTTIKN